MHRALITLTLLVLVSALSIVTSQAQLADLFAMSKRVGALHEQRKFDAALREGKKFEAEARRRVGDKHLFYALPLLRLANITQSQGNYPEAENYYKRALAIMEPNMGADHVELTPLLSDFGRVYVSQARYGDAEKLFRRALSIREKKLGPDHLDTAATLVDLAGVYKTQGRYSEAERTYRRALSAKEGILGSTHIEIAHILTECGIAAEMQGKYGEAGEFFARSASIWEVARGAKAPEVGINLRNLAYTYESRGRYAEAERVFKRSLEILEARSSASQADLAGALVGLANVYHWQGKSGEAESLLKRAIAIVERIHGSRHRELARVLNNLAAIYESQGKYTEAETVYRRVLAIKEESASSHQVDVALTLVNLALVYHDQGRYLDAELMYKKAIEIMTETRGPTHPDLAQAYQNIADTFQVQGKFAQAQDSFRRALAIREERLGRDHPAIAASLLGLSGLEKAAGNLVEALAYSRRAISIAVAHANTQSIEIPYVQQRSMHGHRYGQADPFRQHVAIVSGAVEKQVESQPALTAEAFEVMQRALQSSTALAIHQMASRSARTDDALGALVRTYQDMAALWREKDQALVAALANFKDEQNQLSISSLRQEILSVETDLNTTIRKIESNFPEYATLVHPKPLQLKEVQNLLGDEEGLVAFLSSPTETYVFAVTRQDVAWRRLLLGEGSLSELVTRFRRGLDVGELNRSITGGEPILFDLSTSYKTYVALLDPVGQLIREKRHLLIVPSGALTALPFHLLITDKPLIGAPAMNDIGLYRDAEWLVKRHAVTVLPSVSSLMALRSIGRGGGASKPLVGFGDPVFKDDLAPAERHKFVLPKRTARTTRAYTEYWRAAGIDRKKLAEALPRLEDTADELREVAAKLGAPAGDIYLGDAASETTVKSLKLSDYRIVYFATHGLVAGDVKGLGEPALALTIPAQPTDLDDGLLTASEVAQLKLNADWVVLSACNTVAGDKPGAEALSGLARAFFYAGARAVLVSHWAVDSAAATRLTTAVFEELRLNHSLNRSEALRLAMLTYLRDTSNQFNAYPAFWGPFLIVGDGR